MKNNYYRKPLFILMLATLSLLILTACSPSAEKLNQDGNDAFTKEQFEEALSAYQSAQIENPELAEPYYNSANTLYRQGDYAAAMEQLQIALSYAEGDTLAENSYFNLGNSFFNNQELDPAVENYKQALLLNPDDQDAKYNLELALQQQQQQQQQEQEQQQEQNQEQDQSGDGESQEEEQSEGNDGSEGEKRKSQEQNQEKSQDGENQQQDDTQQGDQKQNEGESEYNDQGQQPNEAQDSEEEGQGQPSQVPAPGERMTEEQARQLLAAIARNSDTLMERLEQIFFVRELPPVQDW